MIIGIVGIVVSIAIPAMAAAKESAALGSCASHAHECFSAVSLYSGSFDDKLPTAKDCVAARSPYGFAEADSSRLESEPLISKAVLKYAKSPSVFVCPRDTGYEVFGFDRNYALFRPSMAKSCGFSYAYRVDLGLRGESLSANHGSAILADYGGWWHGGGSAPEPGTRTDLFPRSTEGYEYNVVYGDGHIKVRSGEQLQKEWRHG